MRLIVPKDTESCSLIDVQVGKALHPNLHEVSKCISAAIWPANR